ncbi:DNA primase [Chlamydiifrater phoenicopteri]|uniref:DNA primase n=1 Tax=Chlamydiifrater phoenicopteri TaxID=2681469 RepID=UPI001BD1262F|nr:DNA primase [Chlamydiifrater phoenicopteri]
MYTEESLDNLRQSLDIVEVLSEHISLRKSGATYKSCCPFHSEKTPSFIVNPATSRYRCFGCGASGDALTFLMQHQGYSFTEAVILLAKKFQVKLVLQAKEGSQESSSEKNELREACAEAEKIFCYCIRFLPEGHQAQKYLFARGIAPDTINRFRIGYAPSSALFLQMAKERGVRRDFLIRAGIIKEKHLLFANRIVFPIRDLLGRTIGFSSRKFLPNTYGGKYVNSPETVIFKKSRTFFGADLSRRRIAKEGRAILVEGQVDCLQMIESGFNCTLATQGTAFSEEHVRELEKLGVKRLYLLFDGDQAGRAAALKVGDLCQQSGIAVFVCLLPSGEDPDSFLISKGVEKLVDLINNGEEYLAFMLFSSRSKCSSASPVEKAAIIETISAKIKKWGNPLVVHESLKKLASLMKVPEELVVGKGPFYADPIFAKVVSSNGKIKEIFDANLIMETDVLRCMIFCKGREISIFQTVEKYLGESNFRHDACRNLFKALVSYYRRHKECMSSEGALHLIEDEEVLELLTKRLVDISDVSKVFVRSLQKLLDREWKEGQEALRIAIREKEQKGEECSLTEYVTVSGNRPIISLVDSDGLDNKRVTSD